MLASTMGVLENASSSEAFLHLNRIGAYVERFVLMIDAGYLLVQSVKYLSDSASHKRSELNIKDPRALISGVIASAVSVMELDDRRELLRVYWYDGVGADGMTLSQRQIIDVDDVQLRAGTINGRRQQKGVDSLIVTDLVELATNRAVCDAIVVTGDSDLAVGIEIAQKRGVRIGVLGLEHFGKTSKVTHNISPEISNLADRVGFLDLGMISSSLEYVPKLPVPKPEPSPLPSVAQSAGGKSGRKVKEVSVPRSPLAEISCTSECIKAPIHEPVPPEAIETVGSPAGGSESSTLQELITRYISERALDSTAIDENSGRINSHVDREMLAFLKTALGRNLNNDEKISMRDIFRATLLNG